MSVKEYKIVTEKDQYLVTVKWPVYIDMRVEANSEEEALKVAEYLCGFDALYTRKHAVEFEPNNNAVLDMEVNIWDEHMEVIECENDTPPRSLEGGE